MPNDQGRSEARCLDIQWSFELLGTDIAKTCPSAERNNTVILTESGTKLE
jgi:hypothetical protein